MRIGRAYVSAVAAAFALAGVVVAVPESAQAADDASGLANAIVGDASTLVSAEMVSSPPLGTPTAVFQTPLSGFPQAGSSFAALSTGNAFLATTPNSSGSSGASNSGAPIRGGAYDAVVLAVKVNVPSGRNCAKVDFRFLSEEYPEYVGSTYNDSFIIELDRSTWQANGTSGVTAPDNFAFDPTGAPITINATGATSMTAADAAGTTYDGATPLLTAAVPVQPGQHTFYFSIFDQGDYALDSAAFVDNLRFSEVSSPALNCQRGAQLSAEGVATPLLAAHGITGHAEDLTDNLHLAKQLVPSLLTTKSSATGARSSVWANGAQIIQDAAWATSFSGQPQVNVIAHSKGGLDSRVAMWEQPQLFAKLGMLATPNGGSTAADTLCQLRRLPAGDQIQPGFGPCDSISDGLFDLQPGYVNNVFNKIVRDWPQQTKYVVAGDCTTLPLDAQCLAADRTVNSCAPAQLKDHMYNGDDSAVCVASAFARTPLVTDPDTNTPGGTDNALLPVFNLSHTGMRQNPCPTSQLIASMYGQRNTGNPYTAGTKCAAANPEPSPTPGPTPVPTLNQAKMATAAAPATEPASVPAAVTQQKVQVLTLSAGAPGHIQLDPEGAGAAQVRVLSNGPLSASVTTPEGADDPLATVSAAQQDGGYITVVSLAPGDSSVRTLAVTSATDTTVGVLTYVQPGQVALSAQVNPTSPSEGTLEATVTGTSPSDLANSSLQAVVGSGTSATTVPLQPTKTAGVYSGTVPLAPGTWTPVDVTLTGPVTRTLTVGAVTSDGSGQILQATGAKLVDTDSNGTLDTLQVDVPVHVNVPGSYELAADFSTGKGIAFSAPGTADLPAGDGVITLQAPVAALIAAGADGPYTLTNGILTRTSDSTRPRVATADTFGTVGSYPISSLTVDRLGLYSPELSFDAASVSLVASARAAVVDPGTYRLSGTLTGPDGQKIEVQSRDLDVAAGVSPLTLQFNAAGLPAGAYTVDDLTIAAAENPGNEAIAGPATYALSDHSQPAPSTVPTLRSSDSVTLTNQFQTGGPHGDVVTAGDFSCNSSVHVAGDVIAAGTVSMTNDCRIDGSVHAGASVRMDSNAKVGGDVSAVGDVSVQSTVTIGGSVTAGGQVASNDGRTLDQLHTAGAIAGTITPGAVVPAPTIPDAAPVSGPDGNWPGITTMSWTQWMNHVATANQAPSWSAGLTDKPGCVMAPWGASVNGTTALVEAPTVVDARTSTTGCSDGVTLQGMTIQLGADLVIYADRLSVVNGLKVQSHDGQPHELRILVPSSSSTTSDTTSVTVTNGIDTDAQTNVQVVTGGRVQVNGTAALSAQIDAGQFTSSGSVTLNRASLSTKDTT